MTEKGNPLLYQNMISKELLQELQLIIHEEYGQNLSDTEVSEVGNLLVDSFSILLNESDSPLKVTLKNKL